MDNNYNSNYEERVEQVVKEYKNRVANQLNEQYYRETKWADRLADHIAAFGGSWKFIILFASFLVLWITVNTIGIIQHFDPIPFILLNLILSFIAAFQAPIIMMSQNRQAARDKHESLIDFAINFKAEKEIADMQRHLHRIEVDIKEIKRVLLVQDPEADA